MAFCHTTKVCTFGLKLERLEQKQLKWECFAKYHFHLSHQLAHTFFVFAENKTYTTDYDQHVAALTFAISHPEMTTMLFYDLFMWPIEWMFALNTQYGQMLREALTSFQKATKFVHLMINVVASFYATSHLDHERLFEGMTKMT